MNLDLKPLQILLTEGIPASELAALLDELIYSYMLLLVREQKGKHEVIHERADDFVFYVKILRDTLLDCEK